MNYCDICFDPPQPMQCTLSGTVRLDAVDGTRRLLGDMAFSERAQLHFVEVEAHRRVWSSEQYRLCAVTVYNRSSLPLTEVRVAPGTAVFSSGLIRVNGVAAGPCGAVISGLGPGCAAVVTWEAAGCAAPEARMAPAIVSFAYQFGGEDMAGEITSV